MRKVKLVKRNTNHTGSIFPNEKNNGFIGNVQVNGKKIKRRGKTVEEVQAKLNEYVDAAKSGLDVTIDDRVSTLAAKYLEIAKRKTATSTVEGYETELRLRILPTFQNKKVRDITTSQADDWISSLESEGVSTYSINNARKIAIQLFNYALKLNLVNRNPFKYSEKVKHEQRDKHPLSAPEINIFLTESAEDKYAALFMLLVTTGMRVGEAQALTWDDINFSMKQIVINKTYSSGELKKSAKTEKGNRKITIGEELSKALMTHLVNQQEIRANLGSAYNNNNLVFPNSIGNYESLGNIRTRHFDPIIKKSLLNNKTTIHDLRHTFASINLMEGVPVLVVSNHLGHANPSITLDIYSHYIPESAESPSITLERIIKEVEVK